jgi:hypothetical protein
METTSSHKDNMFSSLEVSIKEIIGRLDNLTPTLHHLLEHLSQLEGKQETQIDPSLGEPR